jgi:uncharacterized membrane protein YhaH (DUF805 family)
MSFLKLALGRLTDFSGRDPRRLFWPYVGAVIALTIIVMGAINSVVIGLAMSTTASNQMPDLSGMILAMGAQILVVVGLLAAAVVRRLHDTGRAGYWGLAPLPFLTFSLIAFYSVIKAFNQPTGEVPPLFFAVFFSNMFYMAALLLLVVLLALPTKAGANRYGEPPTA